jgi:elongation factor G
VREAVAAAGPVLLEPVDEVEVTVVDDQLGAVLADLAARHGRVVGTEPDDEHSRRTRVRAEVPEVALRRYAVDLRALSGGAAHFTRRFSRYESVAAGS